MPGSFVSTSCVRLNLIEEHGSGKGLRGYLDGSITKPPLITLSPGDTPPASTPVYCTAPLREEWTYRDGVMKSIIVTNIVDPIGLGINRDGTVKECWDSVVKACAAKNEAALSLAQRPLRSKANTVRMMGGKVEEKEIKNILIRSLPANPRWLGLQGALFGAKDPDEAMALIKTLAINMGMPEHAADATTSTSTAFSTFAPKRRCTNPQCKAINKTSHVLENCYWPGGGKEGQFPPGFGNKRHGPQANQASTSTGSAVEPPVHHVLMARVVHITKSGN
ncbi:hypothetical protein C8R44DRAFT_744229 [Mycena epipterygia]|nr:hypothetical protein C8R44DRAFT_744229 [Mycena epipterygia]